MTKEVVSLEDLTRVLDEVGAPGHGEFAGEEEHLFTWEERIRSLAFQRDHYGRALHKLKEKPE